MLVSGLHKVVEVEVVENNAVPLLLSDLSLYVDQKQSIMSFEILTEISGSRTLYVCYIRCFSIILGVFVLDSYSGHLTVVKAFDRETQDVYELEIVVKLIKLKGTHRSHNMTPHIVF